MTHRKRLPEKPTKSSPQRELKQRAVCLVQLSTQLSTKPPHIRGWPVHSMLSFAVPDCELLPHSK